MLIVVFISIPILLQQDHVKFTIVVDAIQRLHQQRVIAQKLSFCIVVAVTSMTFHRFVSCTFRVWK